MKTKWMKEGRRSKKEMEFQKTKQLTIKSFIWKTVKWINTERYFNIFVIVAAAAVAITSDRLIQRQTFLLYTVIKITMPVENNFGLTLMLHHITFHWFHFPPFKH